MGGYERMYRCKKCFAIYRKYKVPDVCPKCGSILTSNNMWFERIPSKNLETIIAKKVLFGYKVLEVIEE